MRKPAPTPVLSQADQALHGPVHAPARQRGFVFWAIWVNIATYAIYPTANWLASLRDQRYDFITRWDAMIPLVPEFIFVYFSFSRFWPCRSGWWGSPARRRWASARCWVR